MDIRKTGELLYKLRREKGITQKQAAEFLRVSDRTVSKWERGAGLPDVSLWQEISALYGVDIEKILSGNLQEQKADTGNMKQIKFYRCSRCGNVLWSTGGGEISCCGRKLIPLQAKPADEIHNIRAEEIDQEYYITFAHEMKKEHYIIFSALVSWDRMTVVRLYPEQAAEVRMPRQQKGELYLCCSEHGLFCRKI